MGVAGGWELGGGGGEDLAPGVGCEVVAVEVVDAGCSVESTKHIKTIPMYKGSMPIPR